MVVIGASAHVLRRAPRHAALFGPMNPIENPIGYGIAQTKPPGVRISNIQVYRVDLPLNEGAYRFSGGRVAMTFDSTIVRIDTDAGVSGYGEFCPLPAYLPAFPEGARAAIAILAPALIGADPRELGNINRRMDEALRGHGYAKSAIDIACWDILGKSTDLPIVTLLGGRCGEDYALYRAISQESPEAMVRSVKSYRNEGYRKFQLKVGGEPDLDIERISAVAVALAPGDVLVADANGGWTQHEAVRVVDAVRALDVYIEQPCATYEECLAVRSKTDRPFILDEVIDGIAALLRAHADHAMDAINLKISKVGGLTKARQIRDVCISLGIAMTIEDQWGSDIITAAIAHLAHSTPSRLLFSSTDFNSYVTLRTADGAPIRKNGRLAASTAPGLGITVLESIGEPI